MDQRERRELSPLAWMLVLAPIHLAWIGILWAGWRLVTGPSLPLGVLLIGAGGVTGVLAVRYALAFIRAKPGEQLVIGPQSAQLDYLVWAVFFVPILLGLALLVFVLLGGQ